MVPAITRAKKASIISTNITPAPTGRASSLVLELAGRPRAGDYAVPAGDRAAGDGDEHDRPDRTDLYGEVVTAGSVKLGWSTKTPIMPKKSPRKTMYEAT